MYHHWECSSIYQPLSYPFRFLRHPCQMQIFYPIKMSQILFIRQKDCLHKSFYYDKDYHIHDRQKNGIDFILIYVENCLWFLLFMICQYCWETGSNPAEINRFWRNTVIMIRSPLFRIITITKLFYILDLKIN